VKRSPLRRVSAKRRTANLDPARSAMRARVLLRDGGCQAIGLYDHDCAGPVDPHHLWREGQGGPWEEWNLLSLCRVAHSYVHGNPARSYELGLLVPSWSGQAGCATAQALREMHRRSML